MDFPSLIITTIDYFFTTLVCLIIINAILSWFPIDRSNPFVSLVRTLTDPIMLPIRNLVRKSPLGGPGMVFDFSPLIAYFLLNYLLRPLTLQIAVILINTFMMIYK